MYFDQDKSRTNWKFTYTGKELQEPTKNLYLDAHNKEDICRKQMSDLVHDPLIHHDSPVLQNLTKEMEIWGRQKEECGVLCHEFDRNPEREFHLSLGDVVFFGLSPLLNKDNQQQDNQQQDN